MDLSYWRTDRLIICAHVGASPQKASRFNVSAHSVLMGMMSPLYVAFCSWKAGWARADHNARRKNNYTCLNSRTYLASKFV